MPRRPYDGTGLFKLLDYQGNLHAKGDETFCRDRLKWILSEDGIEPNFIDSVLANEQFTIVPIAILA